MFQRTLHLVKSSFGLWSTERASSRGAAIAFYTVTSLAPVLLLVIAIAGLVFGEAAARGAVFGQFNSLLGPKFAGTLQNMISGAASTSGGIAATVISVVTILLSASGVFAELEDAVNAIWQAKPESGLKGTARARLLSLGLVIALGFFLIVSLVVEAALKALTNTIPFGAIIGLAVAFFVSLAITSFLFAAIFKFLPARDIAWRDVWVGGIVTAVLFEIGKILLGIYLGNSSSFTSLGAAGALIALLFWVYYTAQIFLFGAAFTRAYAAGDAALADSGNSTRSSTHQARPLQTTRQRELETTDRR